MRNSAEITVEVPLEEAEGIISALEKENSSQKRFSSKISMKGGKLTIRIEADDIVALRATVNSYLRYLQTMESVENAEI